MTHVELVDKLNTALEAVLFLVADELTPTEVIGVLEDLCSRIESPAS